jgi:putative peptidoglycan lipid II flippase
MSEKRPFLRAAGVVGFITIISRFLGLFRDMVLASVFGASRIGDIFQIAFELPNMTRRVLGEGSLSAFIVPIFSRVRAEEGEKRSWQFASNALTTIGLFTFLLMLLGIGLAPWLFKILGYGYAARGDLDAIRLGTFLTRVMFPFQVLLALSAILMGLCHSLRHFSTPSMGSIMLNVTMIATGLAFRKMPDQNRFALYMALAVLAGVVLRIVIMLPPLSARGFRYTFRLRPDSPRMRELYTMMLPALFGMAVAQINITISRPFATSLGEGYLPCLTFSNHLVQMPLAIVGSAFGTAILPQLSQYLIEKRMRDLHNLAVFAFRLILIVFVPATIGLMVLGQPIIQILFQHGNWTATGTQNAYWALLFYSPALVFWGILQILVPVFYAQRDVRTPVIAGAIAVLTNVACNVILVTVRPLREHLGHGGLALANTLGVIVNTTVLQIVLRRRGLPLWDHTLNATIVKTLAAGSAMGAAAWGIWRIVHPFAIGHGRLVSVGALAATIIASVTLYFLVALLVRVPDLHDALRLVLRRGKKALDR